MSFLPPFLNPFGTVFVFPVHLQPVPMETIPPFPGMTPLVPETIPVLPEMTAPSQKAASEQMIGSPLTKEALERLNKLRSIGVRHEIPPNAHPRNESNPVLLPPIEFDLNEIIDFVHIILTRDNILHSPSTPYLIGAAAEHVLTDKPYTHVEINFPVDVPAYAACLGALKEFVLFKLRNRYETSITDRTEFLTLASDYYLHKKFLGPAHTFSCIILGNVWIKFLSRGSPADLSNQEFQVSLRDNWAAFGGGSRSAEEYGKALKAFEAGQWVVDPQFISDFPFTLAHRLNQGFEISPELIQHAVSELQRMPAADHTFTSKLYHYLEKHYSGDDTGKMYAILNFLSLIQKITEVTGRRSYCQAVAEFWSKTHSPFLKTVTSVIAADPDRASEMLGIIQAIFFAAWLKSHPEGLVYGCYASNRNSYYFSREKEIVTKRIKTEWVPAPVQKANSARAQRLAEICAGLMKMPQEERVGYSKFAKMIRRSTKLTPEVKQKDLIAELELLRQKVSAANPPMKALMAKRVTIQNPPQRRRYLLRDVPSFLEMSKKLIRLLGKDGQEVFSKFASDLGFEGLEVPNQESVIKLIYARLSDPTMPPQNIANFLVFLEELSLDNVGNNFLAPAYIDHHLAQFVKEAELLRQQLPSSLETLSKTLQSQKEELYYQLEQAQQLFPLVVKETHLCEEKVSSHLIKFLAKSFTHMLNRCHKGLRAATVANKIAIYKFVMAMRHWHTMPQSLAKKIHEFSQLFSLNLLKTAQELGKKLEKDANERHYYQCIGALSDLASDRDINQILTLFPTAFQHAVSGSTKHYRSVCLAGITSQHLLSRWKLGKEQHDVLLPILDPLLDSFMKKSGDTKEQNTVFKIISSLFKDFAATHAGKECSADFNQKICKGLAVSFFASTVAKTKSIFAEFCKLLVTVTEGTGHEKLGKQFLTLASHDFSNERSTVIEKMLRYALEMNIDLESTILSQLFLQMDVTAVEKIQLDTIQWHASASTSDAKLRASDLWRALPEKRMALPAPSSELFLHRTSVCAQLVSEMAHCSDSTIFQLESAIQSLSSLLHLNVKWMQELDEEALRAIISRLIPVISILNESSDAGKKVFSEQLRKTLMQYHLLSTADQNQLLLRQVKHKIATQQEIPYSTLENGIKLLIDQREELEISDKEISLLVQQIIQQCLKQQQETCHNLAINAFHKLLHSDETSSAIHNIVAELSINVMKFCAEHSKLLAIHDRSLRECLTVTLSKYLTHFSSSQLFTFYENLIKTRKAHLYTPAWEVLQHLLTATQFTSLCRQMCHSNDPGLISLVRQRVLETPIGDPEICTSLIEYHAHTTPPSLSLLDKDILVKSIVATSLPAAERIRLCRTYFDNVLRMAQNIRNKSALKFVGEILGTLWKHEKEILPTDDGRMRLCRSYFEPALRISQTVQNGSRLKFIRDLLGVLWEQEKETLSIDAAQSERLAVKKLLISLYQKFPDTMMQALETAIQVKKEGGEILFKTSVEIISSLLQQPEAFGKDPSAFESKILMLLNGSEQRMDEKSSSECLSFAETLQKRRSQYLPELSSHVLGIFLQSRAQPPKDICEILLRENIYLAENSRDEGVQKLQELTKKYFDGSQWKQYHKLVSDHIIRQTKVSLDAVNKQCSHQQLVAQTKGLASLMEIYQVTLVPDLAMAYMKIISRLSTTFCEQRDGEIPAEYVNNLDNFLAMCKSQNFYDDFFTTSLIMFDHLFVDFFHTSNDQNLKTFFTIMNKVISERGSSPEYTAQVFEFSTKITNHVLGLLTLLDSVIQAAHQESVSVNLHTYSRRILRARATTAKLLLDKWRGYSMASTIDPFLDILPHFRNHEAFVNITNSELQAKIAHITLSFLINVANWDATAKNAVIDTFVKKVTSIHANMVHFFRNNTTTECAKMRHEMASIVTVTLSLQKSEKE